MLAYGIIESAKMDYITTIIIDILLIDIGHNTKFYKRWIMYV